MHMHNLHTGTAATMLIAEYNKTPHEVYNDKTTMTIMTTII